jgi:hypothetical protein
MVVLKAAVIINPVRAAAYDHFRPERVTNETEKLTKISPTLSRKDDGHHTTTNFRGRELRRYYGTEWIIATNGDPHLQEIKLKPYI